MDDREKIKQKLDLAEFIGQYVTLKKAGRNFKANCPFHNEKSPSFVVSPERAIWHCFGCNKGGDIFSFVMEYDRLDFIEALKVLADRAGIKLSGQTTFQNDTEKKRDRIYTLNALSAQFYQYLLEKHPSGKVALEYLVKTRQIPLPLIQKFGIGYAPNNYHTLTDFLIKKKEYMLQDVLEAGLATEKNGRSFDFFRHRIIFPIKNTRGNIMAFSGRALDNESMPKYINSRETLAYKKGDTLFGLDLAIEAIKKEKRVIVAEGEFDVISSVRVGVENIVAIKGTALTESQIKILKRYAEKICFCFDSDAAGTEAQRRSIEMIEKWGLLASVIPVPEGKDLDELIKTDPVAFKKTLKHDISVYEFFIESRARELDLTSMEGKRTMAQKTLPFLLSIQNEVIKEHYLKLLATRLDTSLESLLKQGEKIERENATPSHTDQSIPAAPKKSREEITEEYLLSLLLQEPSPNEYCEIVSNVVESIPFYNPAYHRLFHYLSDFCKTNQEFSVQNFTNKLPAELLDTFDRCYLAPIPQFKSEKDYREEIERVAREVKLLSVKNKLHALSAEIKSREENSTDEDIELLRVEFNRLTELLK